MQTKLITPDVKKIHFSTDTIQEANLIKNELQQMGYKVLLFNIKEKEKKCRHTHAVS